MKEYLNVKWKDDIVGKVFINEEGKYRYIPDEEMISRLSKEGMPCIFVIKKQENWEEGMPVFIENRLKLNLRGVVITDHFSFEKVED